MRVTGEPYDSANSERLNTRSSTTKPHMLFLYIIDLDHSIIKHSSCLSFQFQLTRRDGGTTLSWSTLAFSSFCLTLCGLQRHIEVAETNMASVNVFPAQSQRAQAQKDMIIWLMFAFDSLKF